MDIYDQLGIKKYVNAHDTCTIYGGSRMESSTLKAMEEAAAHFVDLQELQDVLGNKIAELTNNEGAYLTSGASAGLMLAVVAVLAGDNIEAFKKLPAETDEKNEIVIMKCQQNPFVSAITAAGATLKEAGSRDFVTTDDLENAVGEKTAGVVYFAASNLAEKALPLEAVIETAKRVCVPVIVDAAAQLPPVENLWHYTGIGADMAVFSGGKTLCGPQSSGLILGRRSMIDRCKSYGAPIHGVCRSAKIGKEEMVGLYMAVKNYVSLDHAGNRKRLTDICRRLSQDMNLTGALRTEVINVGPAGQDLPLTYGYITAAFSPQQLCDAMKADGIYIGVKEDAIFINPLNLRPHDVEKVIKSLRNCIETLSNYE